MEFLIKVHIHVTQICEKLRLRHTRSILTLKLLFIHNQYHCPIAPDILFCVISNSNRSLNTYENVSHTNQTALSRILMFENE